MDTVGRVVGYVYDPQKWISYYEKKPEVFSLPQETAASVVVSTQPEKIKQVVEKSCKKAAHHLEDAPIDTGDKKELEMKNDIELVSPVQGAVQQAKAAYARAPPIKRRRKHVIREGRLLKEVRSVERGKTRRQRDLRRRKRGSKTGQNIARDRRGGRERIRKNVTFLMINFL